MKMLSIILVLMIAAQPVQAGFCDMHPSGGATQDQDMDMQHAGMQSEPGHDSDSHGCCASPNPESDPDCAGLDQCGSCAAGLAAVPVRNRACALPTASDRVLPIANQLAPSHAAPPYRPPSTIS